MSLAKPNLGQWGELIGLSFLEKKGYKICHKNWRCPLGEIDLVARDSDVLAFIEVKSRTSSEFGPPEAAVTLAKQRRLIRLAQAYTKRYGIRDVPLRFDVIAITCDGPVLYKDAFWAEY